MPLYFTALASGSAGNAALVEADGHAVLIDVGLGPRTLADRMARIGRTWAHVRAVVLTHTHGDHWKDTTLAYLRRRNIPFYCHLGHHDVLTHYSPGFTQLVAAGLVRTFDEHEEFSLAPQFVCQALPVSHDSGPTFGFRLEGCPDLFGEPAAIGYVSDLGCWTEDLAAQLADVDLLAVEFNHDVDMQHASRRPRYLVRRVLSDQGHLSNRQGADLVRAVLDRSEEGRLEVLVQLHLSRECNRSELARTAVRKVLDELEPPPQLVTAAQDEPTPLFAVGASAAKVRRVRRPSARPPRVFEQPWLPGLESA